MLSSCVTGKTPTLKSAENMERAVNIPSSSNEKPEVTSSTSMHPSLGLTKKGIEKIRNNIGKLPLFDKQIAAAKKNIEAAIATGIDVPIPKDMAGGYTHETHKQNYKLMQQAGNLYQITGDEKYAAYVKEMLMEYCEMYPSLPIHPTKRSYATGKIFWQCLNDANWMVFTSQAYDCIHDYLTPTERDKLETDLFIPFANFLSEGNPRFFNRIHNHSTWANAAVGMMALAMNNDTLLHKALYGLQDDGIDASEFDNDGGFIKTEGVTTAGFLAQLDNSFSPDGYFAEGPYYLRYAIFPFLVFSHALHNNKPELDIFNYREGILKKATNTLLQLTDSNGHFFPINDAQKGMSYKSYELVDAVGLIYYVDDKQDYLLDWAAAQNVVSLNEAGFNIANALTNHKANQPSKKSMIFRDGVKGDGGGVAVLRAQELEVLFKFSTQGMGHGHFDRLSYSLYDNTGEVIQDYGAVRWVNVDQKGGGRYLPENKTFGKQSIAHNTIVINEGSHYGGSVKEAEKSNPSLFYHDFKNENIKIISALENNAYENVEMQKTIFLIDDKDLNGSLMIDISIVNTPSASTIEIPVWYMGQKLKSSFDGQKKLDQLVPLGKQNGYQHIWKESSSTIDNDSYTFNWFGDDKFYTLHGVSKVGDKIILGRAGANDPDFNLRSDPVLIHRREGSKSTSFVNLIEAHGNYSRITEVPSVPYALINDVTLKHSSEDYTIFTFSSTQYVWDVMIANKNDNLKANHSKEIGGKVYSWTGFYKLNKNKKP